MAAADSAHARFTTYRLTDHRQSELLVAFSVSVNLFVCLCAFVRMTVCLSVWCMCLCSNDCLSVCLLLHVPHLLAGASSSCKARFHKKFFLKKKEEGKKK